MFLTERKWLALFDLKPDIEPKPISLDKFIKTFKVKSTRLFPLNDVIKSGKYKPNDLYPLLDFYNERDVYLTRFYKNNLEVPFELNSKGCLINKNENKNNIKKTFDFSHLKPEINNTRHPQFKTVSRNIYYKEILEETCTVQGNVPSFLLVLKNFFNKNIIDYKLLSPSILKLIGKGKIGAVLSGIYFRASILNPFLAYSVFKLYGNLPSDCKNATVLTPTLGWSTYMEGIMQDKCVENYIGIDVIPAVCLKTKKISKMFYPNKKINIFCTPSEKVYENKKIMEKIKNKVDFIFFSPPYYELELYKGGKQSTNSYDTYEEWLEGYWIPTMKLCYESLKKNKRMCYIISGYKSGKDSYNLEKDMVKISKDVGFNLIKKYYLVKGNVGFTTHRKYQETLFIFSK